MYHQSSFPKKVLLREDGPREGFQMHPDFVPTQEKVKLIDALSTTGISSIEVTSFVRTDLLPQMADAELVAARFEKKDGVRYRALYLNEKGFHRANSCSRLDLEGSVMIAASERFLKMNNNLTLERAIAGLDAWVGLFHSIGLVFDRIMFSMAFGDGLEGRIPTSKIIEICKSALNRLEELGTCPQEVTFADTAGWANPEGVRRLVGDFQNHWPHIAVGLHFHDTRGLGIANVYAGLQAGVARFDCSLGGLGGCPNVPGASGNVATEEVAFLCEELGIATGLNLEAYIECVKLAEQIVQQPLPGKLARAGLLAQNGAP